MTANERVISVKSELPAHLIWSAAEHAKNKDVTIRLSFVNTEGSSEWLFSNRDVLGIRHHPVGGPNLIIYLTRGIKIIYDTHLREGSLIERR